jgi:hypothetical protein
VGGDRIAVPYREDWEPLTREGFAAYAQRVGKPYADAVRTHLHPDRSTHTERILGRLGRDPS